MLFSSLYVFTFGNVFTSQCTALDVCISSHLAYQISHLQQMSKELMQVERGEWGEGREVGRGEGRGDRRVAR